MMRGIRRRTVVLTGIAALGVLTAGVVFILSRPPADPGSPAPAGLTARVVGDEVYANGIRLRVPSGWTVTQRGDADYCGQPDRTVLIGTDLTHGHCTWREVIAVDHWNAESFSPQWRPGSLIVREMTLPGGQPVWITDPFGDRRASQPPPEITTFTAFVPWASVRLEFSLRGPTLAAVLQSVRSDPVAAARLTVSPRMDAMAVSGAGALPRDSVDRVRALFAELDQPVGADVAPCADAVFYGGWRWSTAPSAVVELFDHGRRVGSIALLRTYDGCEVITSSRGGRVFVPVELQETYRGVFGTGRAVAA